MGGVVEVEIQHDCLSPSKALPQHRALGCAEAAALGGGSKGAIVRRTGARRRSRVRYPCCWQSLVRHIGAAMRLLLALSVAPAP